MPTKGQFATVKRNSIFFPRPSTQYFTIRRFSINPKTNVRFEFTTIFGLFFHSFQLSACVRFWNMYQIGFQNSLIIHAFSRLKMYSSKFQVPLHFSKTTRFNLYFQHNAPLLRNCPANKTRCFIQPSLVIFRTIRLVSVWLASPHNLASGFVRSCVS